MKIAIVSTPFVPVPPREYGGTELVLGELANGLVGRGHDVTLYATGDSTSSVRVRALYEEPVWPPSALPDLNHASWATADAAEWGADVIHVNSPSALVASRHVPEIPLVHTIHHARDEAISAYYRFFDGVQYVAISEAQARREPDPSRLAIIHHGLDASTYEWTRTSESYVFFIGRFAPYKGVHTAIDVAERAGRRIRVAGTEDFESDGFIDGEIRPRLRRRHVEHIGPVGLHDKVSLLRDARALLAPITWEEPFGLVFIEAMLSGCPVVAFPRGSVPEVVDPAVTGFVVHDEREMADVIRPGGPIDEFDRERCRARAVERFDARRMVVDYERLYEAVRGGGTPHRRRPRKATRSAA